MIPNRAGFSKQTVRQPCHFGEWLQGRMGPQGPVVLVTLIPDGLQLRARKRAGTRLAVKVAGATASFPVPTRALHRFLSNLGLPQSGYVFADPPFPVGLGTGASTATLIATARLAGFRGQPADLARACIAAEGASDPLMFEEPDQLLWASREGKVVATGPPVPRAHLLAGFFGPPLPTRAADTAYADISDLVSAWQRARSLGDWAAFASESATRCLALRGPSDDPTAQLARDLGALGWATSHSGAARALIFAPGTLPQGAQALMREAGLRSVQPLFTGGKASQGRGGYA